MPWTMSMSIANLHKLLPDYQLAYWNGYSCETAIIKLVKDIFWAMENQCMSLQ